MESRALPSGTVVFLFSDVEGSTRRWDAAGDAMRDALRRHDEMLRFEIELRRGYVFKTIGDAFCAAFWTVQEALEAAVEIQRRLAREDFSGVGGLRVRMSIHAGETDERAGDYFGLAVNRTSRLLSAGHGGQILLSRVAAEMAMPDLPASLALRHLGSLPLRDLDQPESVYQPVVADMPSEFAPLRALATPPNNLPRQATSFVGRHEDVTRVNGLLDRSALVTIAGAGGIGKTRLALEVASSRLSAEPDGAWFIDLSSILEARPLAGAVLAALGAEGAPDGEPLDALLAYLEKRQLLLLLDNSEHLVTDVAVIVGKIIARCPHVTVLATSREPLDVTGERIYRLGTLDLAAATMLFADRARAVDPGFALDDARPVVDDICRRLDGIALAIELAAARVRAMSVEDVAAHLELRLLAGGRDRRPRQQTMRALIDWSYDLLTAEEQRILRHCAVFVRGFSLPAAAAVFGDDGESSVFEAIVSLVDKSLVVAETQEGQRRYRLLEPIREYAGEKLAEASETAEALRRHADVFAEVADAAYDEWERGPRPDWLARMERDVPNVRAAIRWSIEEERDFALAARIAAGTTPVFLRLSLLVEAIEWCERILSFGAQLPNELEARLRYGLSMLYSNQGLNKKILDEALKAEGLFRSAGDSRGLARALSQAASRYAVASRFDEAREMADEALTLARQSGDRRLLADTLRRCAEAFSGGGPEAPRALFAESVDLFRSLGRDDDTSRALQWWAQWEAETGNFTTAAERLLEAKQLEAGDASAMYIVNDIASCLLATGDRARAEPFAREALLLGAKAKHPILLSLSIVFLAAIVASANAPHSARLIGYARERLRSAEWQLVPYEQSIVDRLLRNHAAQFGEAELNRLLREGEAWTEEQAVTAALSVSGD